MQKKKQPYDHPEFILMIALEQGVLMASPNPAVDDVDWDDSL